MSRITFLLSFLCLALASSAQREHFVYLQSEDGQPFYLRMNDQTFSSTASGYLILSKLRDSSYTFRLGWPARAVEQPYFTVPVAGKDRGMLIKNFGAEGWGLFDLQSLQILRSHSAPVSAGAVRMEPRQVSNFTDVLSKAANDPSLKMQEVKTAEVKKENAVEQPVVVAAAEPVNKVEVDSVTAKADSAAIAIVSEKIPEESPDNQVRTAKLDSIAAVNKAAVEPPKEEQPRPNEPIEEKRVAEELPTSTVVRRAESSTTEGFSVTYIDQYTDGRKDTVRIMIPNKPVVVAPVAKPVSEEQKFLDIPVSATDSVVPSNDCVRRATDADFLKLRRDMVGEKTDDAMIKVARKAFGQKCYSVKQVKNLGAVFLNDAARFQFFEAAYPHVSDLANFPSLGEELKNEYYLRRFKGIGK
ncbi:MAG: DUF4476 domain-containing protein [Chitinophagaceae bacterium]